MSETPEPISILPFGERQRVKRAPVWGPTPPREHRCCEKHPGRYVAQGGKRCWWCEEKRDQPEFDELDRLIAKGATAPRMTMGELVQLEERQRRAKELGVAVAQLEPTESDAPALRETQDVAPLESSTDALFAAVRAGK